MVCYVVDGGKCNTYYVPVHSDGTEKTGGSNMTSVMTVFKVMIMVQLFYAASITMLAYAIPAENRDYITSFSDLAEDIDLEGTSSRVQSSLEQQTNIPLIELGALVFFSGNILIDLILNFIFAIPQMVGLLVNGFMILFNVDTFIFAIVQLFASVVILVLYFISIIQLLMGARSGNTIV